MDRGDQVEGAQEQEAHGVTHLIRDAEGLHLLPLGRQADHLRRDVDTDHLGRAALLQQPSIEAQAAGQIHDALAFNRTHHAEERIALRRFQRRGAGILVVLAADAVIHRAWLRHRRSPSRRPIIR